MKRCSIDIPGMPYFPGVAVGRLHRGLEGAIADRIVLILQQDITAFDTLPAGFIIVEAAPLSHAMIGLLGLGVPTVLIGTSQAALLRDDVDVLIDGISGRITDDIDERLTAPVAGIRKRVVSQAGQAVAMADGAPVSLCASIRSAAAARQALDLGAHAIGLVRSEYLLPADGGLPDAAFCHKSFREICEAATSLPVTFRLLDVAADKMPSWLPHAETLGQALGLQGVRLYGLKPVRDVIDNQLAALAQLVHTFDLRLIIPFLVRLEEFEYWLGLVRQRLPNAVPVGAMAETPASVLDIARLLERADFVAVGCNDLMQGLFAADRDQAEMRHYLDPYAPLLYRLFRQMAEQSGDQLHKVQLCGVLSQIQGVLPVLLGLGYRRFSVDAPFIPYLADIVSNTTQAECAALATQVCAARTTQEVLEILELPTDRHPPFLN